jgi:uncharacterized membrane protein
MQILHWISADSRRRFVIGLLAALGTFLCLHNRVSLAISSIVTWDAFAISSLILAWITIAITHQRSLRAYAKLQDLSRGFISAFVVAAACGALFAVAFLIRTHHAEMRTSLASHVLLALGTVALSWALLNTVFSLHYAHVFYGDSDDDNNSSHAGGLDFPKEPTPDYFDFAYFSFVIGMTCQVSDVQVTSSKMRRLTLLHGILAFGYNTVILALLINTVSGLL